MTLNAMSTRRPWLWSLVACMLLVAGSMRCHGQEPALAMTGDHAVVNFGGVLLRNEAGQLVVEGSLNLQSDNATLHVGSTSLSSENASPRRPSKIYVNSFHNSFQAFANSSRDDLHYYRDGNGLVHIRGYFNGGNGEDAAAVFTLPADYAPPFRLLTQAFANSGYVRVDLLRNGTALIFTNYPTGTDYESWVGMDVIYTTATG